MWIGWWSNIWNKYDLLTVVLALQKKKKHWFDGGFNDDKIYEFRVVDSWRVLRCFLCVSFPPESDKAPWTVNGFQCAVRVNKLRDLLGEATTCWLPKGDLWVPIGISKHFSTHICWFEWSFASFLHNHRKQQTEFRRKNQDSSESDQDHQERDSVKTSSLVLRRRSYKLVVSMIIFLLSIKLEKIFSQKQSTFLERFIVCED